MKDHPSMPDLGSLAGLRVQARLLWSTDEDHAAWLPEGVIEVGPDGRIVAVRDSGPADVRLGPAVLTPGFVDGHLHYPQTRIVGAASGPLLDWLRHSTFPEEARFADAGHARAIADAFCAALAAAGTTLAFVYGSVHPTAADILLQTLADRGLRAIAGPVLMDMGAPDALFLPPDRALPALASLADRWQGHDDGRLQVAAIPRFALSCTADLMRGAAELAAPRGLWCSTHLSENTDEVRVAAELHGGPDYLGIYEALGLVHDRSVYAHCIHMSDEEWDRFAAAGAVVAHCPDSNDFLGSGGMPLDPVRARGIPVVLGTDIAAGRSFRVPRIASSAHDNALRQGVRVPPETWLWHATRGGARALGQPDLGALEPGFQADLVLHDLPAWVDSADDALAWLLFHHDAPPPRGTWIRGRRVWDRDAHWRAGGVFPWDAPGPA
ncbi:MAG: amidohydrolase family protein [Alphaproteobacteria bacterium]|nr:amidohydrolase family protein [Alphaproteobacteria bacterium]